VTHARGEDGVLDTLWYDEAGILFAIDRGGARLYVASDLTGSPRVVTDAAGVVLRAIEYDAFGGVVADSNPGLWLAVGFSGGLADPATGLVRFGWRDYDPRSGRFTARDPAEYEGRQANLYVYCGSDPVTFLDPTGLFTIGGSFYHGIGGGLSVTFNSDGLSVCAEAGFGVGGPSFDIDPFSEPMDGMTLKVKAEVKVSYGPAGVTLKAELDQDGCASFGVEGQLGPVGYDLNDGLKFSGLADDWGPKAMKWGAQGKVVGEACGRVF
jgi:RHS repeat-associated protein